MFVANRGFGVLLLRANRLLDWANLLDASHYGKPRADCGVTRVRTDNGSQCGLALMHVKD